MQELIQVRSQFPAPMTVHYSRQRTITQPITGDFFLVAVFLSSSIASPVYGPRQEVSRMF